eukprot:34125-Eustigmatos_ZCMA.PRE.1
MVTLSCAYMMIRQGTQTSSSTQYCIEADAVCGSMSQTHARPQAARSAAKSSNAGASEGRIAGAG